MNSEGQTSDWGQMPFEFNGTEAQLIEVVERRIHALPGTRKIGFHLSSRERPIHIRQTAAWLEEHELDLSYEKPKKIERTKFIRAVWIGTGEKEYFNQSAQSGLLSINYYYMAISCPLPMPDFLSEETRAAFLNTFVGLAVKISRQIDSTIHGFVECVPLMNKAAVVVIESIQQWNQQTQPITSEAFVRKDLPIYSGYWETEPIVINRWVTTIDVDLEGFDYRFEEGLSEIFNGYSRANQCHPVRRKITKAKIIYIFHWKRREIQFSASLIKHKMGTVKVQIEQYRSVPHSKEYVRSRIDDIIEWLHREYQVQVSEDPTLLSDVREEIASHHTLSIQKPDLQLIYESTVAPKALNDWLRTFFQENKDQMWEVYKDALSWSIAERDIINLIDPTAYTELVVAEFKVIPILFVKSFPVDDCSTQVRIYLGAERINAPTMQSLIKQALEPDNEESEKLDKDNTKFADAGITYEDFDLQIISSLQGYQARVIDSPDGETMAPLDFKLPFSEEELSKIISLVHEVRHYHSSQPNDVTQKQNSTIQTFGQHLFSTVFQGEIRICLERSLTDIESKNKGLRLRLRLNEVPELMNLPWEYLYEPSHYGFFSLLRHVSIVRYLEGRSSKAESLHESLPLHVLVMIAAPMDETPLNVEQEWTQIESALADLIQRGKVVLERLQSATLDALQQRMQQPDPVHIFHFLGHGSDSDNGFGLLLENSNGEGRFVTAEKLASVFRGHNFLRLIFLNACAGAKTSPESPFTGVAQSLVKSGLPAVIAMQSDITDQAAIKLAQWFYKTLANGFPVETALAEARKAIHFDDEISLEWGIPVLYMRTSNGRLFTLD